jgi:hypothetical protein
VVIRLPLPCPLSKYSSARGFRPERLRIVTHTAKSRQNTPGSVVADYANQAADASFFALL